MFLSSGYVFTSISFGSESLSITFDLSFTSIPSLFASAVIAAIFFNTFLSSFSATTTHAT